MQKTSSGVVQKWGVGEVEALLTRAGRTSVVGQACASLFLSSHSRLNRVSSAMSAATVAAAVMDRAISRERERERGGA